MAATNPTQLRPMDSAVTLSLPLELVGVLRLVPVQVEPPAPERDLRFPFTL